MGDFLDAVERALSAESPEEYLKKRIHDLFSEFSQNNDGDIAMLSSEDLNEMLMYLTAFRPELDLPHSKEDVDNIISGLGSKKRLT